MCLEKNMKHPPLQYHREKVHCPEIFPVLQPPPLLQMPETSDVFTVILVFASFRMSYKWNHTVGHLFILTCFTYKSYMFMTHPCFCMGW